MTFMKNAFMAAVAVLVFVAPFSYAGGSSEKAPPKPASSSPSTQAASSGARPYTGDGGKGLSLAVLVPSAQGIGADQNYLPTMIQGVLVGDLTKYSAVSVLDRLKLETVLKETESGIYKNEADFGRLGEITNVDYALTGNITKTGSGYAMQIQVVGTGKKTIGVTKAAYSGSCTIAELDDFTGIRKASLELLTQMGVTLTSAARSELSGAASRESVNAQTALAQGITSQKGGTVVEALSRYIQANDYDPSLAEAASRLNILSVNVSSGNIGADVRNDLQWRDQWVARLKECEEFYANYIKETPSHYLVYSTNIRRGAVDYEKRTVALTLQSMALYPEITWFSTLNRVVKTVRDGLTATKRAPVWGLDDWPRKSISGVNPFVGRVNAFWVEVEILNSEGRSIRAKETVPLTCGWEYEYVYDSEYAEKFSRFSESHTKPYGSVREIVFPAANPEVITDNLSISITAIDGIPSATAAGQKRINILTAAQYVNLPNAKLTAGLAAAAGRSTNEWSFFLRARDYRYTDIAEAFDVEGRYGGRGTRIGRIVVFRQGVTKIEASHIDNGGFSDDGSIIGAIFPNSVTQIRISVFPRLTSITIGANVWLLGEGSRNDLGDAYDRNGKKAGTYSYNGTSWVYLPK